MQNRIVAESVEQAEDVVHGEGASAPAHQLHGFSALEVNAGNDHRVIGFTLFRLSAQADRHAAFGQEFLHRRNRTRLLDEKSKRPAPRPRGRR